MVGPRCGYAQPRPGAPVKPGPCLTVVVVPAPIAPGASTNLAITALTGLPGMSPLAAGSYRVPVPVAIDGHTTALTLTYAVTRSTTASYRGRRAVLSRTSEHAHQPATHAVLYGNAVGTARLGEEAHTAILRLDVLLERGPGKPYDCNYACDFDHEATGLGLTYFFARGRFVGYDYWAARHHATVVLATAKRLRIGGRLYKGRRLYGRAFRVGRAQGGTWSSTTSRGPIFGYTRGDLNGPRATVLAIEAGDVGCPAMTP